MIKIKICGLTREKDIETVNKLKPDYIGFVFATNSKRYVSSEKVKLLKGNLEGGIQVVGVFVNAPIETVTALCREDIIDFIQLHGNEDDMYITELKAYTKKPIIQAYEIKTAEDIKRANGSIADYILLDHGAGGSGESFDWSLLSIVNRPFLLAGGLHPENIEDAIRKAIRTGYLYGVDSSSGVETNGMKDDKKIEKLIQTVRER